MFSKKRLILLFFICAFNFSSYAFIGKTCKKEIQEHYPGILKGSLSVEDQDMFFRCIHDFLELIVNKNIVTHDSSRDFFTKQEVLKLFTQENLLNLPENTSREVVNQIFLVKHIMVGGKRDQLSDKQLQDGLVLIDAYRDFYFRIHKVIPVIRSIFNKEKSGRVNNLSEKKLQIALDKIRQGFISLKDSYQENNIEYPIQDFQHLFDYLSKDYMLEGQTLKQYGIFYTTWVNSLFDSSSIKGSDWQHYFHYLQQLTSMVLYYKEYVEARDISQPQVMAYALKSFGFFISSLRRVSGFFNKQGEWINQKTQGEIPVKNIDRMLTVMLNFSQQNDQSLERIKIFPSDKGFIPLLTRSLTCFSLREKQNSGCKMHEGLKDSSVNFEYHFPDGKIEFYKNDYKWLSQKGSFKISMSQLDVLSDWLANYEQAYQDLLRADVNKVAKDYDFSHWLNGSFGETKEANHRIIFYPYGSKPFYEQLPYRLLNYKFVSNLLLHSYYKNQEGFSIEEAASIAYELSPLLSVFIDNSYDDSKTSKQVLSLFKISDWLLRSSNFDQKIDSKEIFNLIVHVMSAVDNSKYAFSRLQGICEGLEVSCVSKNLYTELDILRPFPRVQNHLQYYSAKKENKSLKKDNSKSACESDKHILTTDQHTCKTEEFLKAKASHLSSPYQLLDLFMIMQVLEVQFHNMDTNSSSRLEKNEILYGTKGLAKQMVEAVPYLQNESQAQSFVIWSFKRGLIPFLAEKDQNFASMHFLHWHVTQRAKDEFYITRGHLFFSTLEFYNLYKKHQ